MTYKDYWSELLGYVPKLSPLLARKLVNRAWAEIREKFLWSFNVAEGFITTPAAVSTGTVTVVQGLATVVGDATADAAWAAIGNSALSVRQFRSGLGPIYNILSYTSPNLTLDRVYAETSAAGAVYSIYQCYYPSPSTDFLRWISVIDPINGYQFSLNHTKQDLDRIDPQRGAQDQPYWISSFRGSLISATLGDPTFELYPHPQTYQAYPVVYQKRGLDFSLPTDHLPKSVSDETLMAKARSLAFRWAMASQTSDKVISANWAFLIKDADAEFKESLEDDIRNDKEAFSQAVPTYIQSQYGGINLWGNYAMTHDVPSGWVF